jgi:hypothetical protein
MTDAESRALLHNIVRDESALLPATAYQNDIAMWSYRQMLVTAPLFLQPHQDGFRAVSGISLCPQGNFERHSVLLTKDCLEPILRAFFQLPNTIDTRGKFLWHLLPMFIQPSVLQNLPTYRRYFGTSLRTNGVEIQARWNAKLQ